MDLADEADLSAVRDNLRWSSAARSRERAKPKEERTPGLYARTERERKERKVFGANTRAKYRSQEQQNPGHGLDNLTDKERNLMISYLEERLMWRRTVAKLNNPSLFAPMTTEEATFARQYRAKQEWGKSAIQKARDPTATLSDREKRFIDTYRRNMQASRLARVETLRLSQSQAMGIEIASLSLEQQQANFEQINAALSTMIDDKGLAGYIGGITVPFSKFADPSIPAQDLALWLTRTAMAQESQCLGQGGRGGTWETLLRSDADGKVFNLAAFKANGGETTIVELAIHPSGTRCER